MSLNVYHDSCSQLIIPSFYESLIFTMFSHVTFLPKMIIFWYSDYLFSWHYFLNLLFKFWGTTVNGEAYVLPHEQLCSFPSLSRPPVVLPVGSMADPPFLMADRSFVPIVYSRLFRPRQPKFTFSIGFFTVLSYVTLSFFFLSQNKAKIQAQSLKKPVNMDPPTVPKRFICPDSRRLYRNVCTDRKVVHGRIIRNSQKVHLALL